MPVQFLQSGTSFYTGMHAKDKAEDAEHNLKAMALNAPKYKANQSILDFYQSSLQKYNTNPTDSAQYKLANQQIKQGTVQGLNALRDRRLGGGVSSLINNQNNALLKAAANGESRKSGELSVLGHAAGMKAQEEGKAFNYNQIRPYEAQYNLEAMRAAGSNQVLNKSIENGFDSANAIQAYYMSKGQNKKDGKTPVSYPGAAPPADYNYTFKGYGTPQGLNY